jgi:hypothetical protein
MSIFGKKRSSVELGREHILQANLEDLDAAKRLIAKVGLRCRDLLIADAMDAHAYAQRECAERVIVAIDVLQEKTRESAA